MNIFVVDEDPRISATMLCDQHVVKMITESAQMLSLWLHSERGEIAVYTSTHENHPCNIWLRKSISNVNWLWIHSQALLDEYNRRFANRGVRTTFVTARSIFDRVEKYIRNSKTLTYPTEFAMAVSDDCKSLDPVAGYRKYYRSKVLTFKHPMRYTNTVVPYWLTDLKDLMNVLEPVDI